jgi:TRAP-type C4-dicarboxylate transport system substrate-binding protein
MHARGISLWIAIAATLVQLFAISTACAQTKYFGYIPAPDGFSERVARELSAQMEPLLKTRPIQPISINTFGGVANAVTALHVGKLSFALLPTSTLEPMVPEIGVLGLPLIFRDVAQASAAANGPVGARLKTLLASKLDVEVLGFLWRVGTFAARTGCISVPDDLKGLKIADGASWYKTLLDVSGANGIVIASPEVQPALQNGAIDGVLFVIEVVANPGVVETARCLTAVSKEQFMILPQVILASKQEAANRPALASLVADMDRKIRSDIAEQTAALERSYRSRDRQVAPFGADQRTKWDEYRDRVYRDFDSRVPGGADLRKDLQPSR